MIWFLPSFYGDIRLEKRGNGTLVTVERATVGEREALVKLSKVSRKKGWSADEVSPEGRTLLGGPMEKVAKTLAKLLKPTRKLVTAVRFSNGQVEELCESDSPAERRAEPSGPYRTPAEKKSVEEKKPEKAITVAAPCVGCPAPDFARADVKAREVLEHFLTPEQSEDFRRYNRFVTVGGTTGHRYMVTSRHARDELAHYQRTLYDLDDERPLCVHDWDVPAAEEMLALHVLVQLPGYESYLRFLEN